MSHAQTGPRAGDQPEGHPLGAGFGRRTTPEAAPQGVIEEGVRAASDLVNEHIRRGEDAVKALGGGDDARIPLSQTDLSGLVTGLVRAYSDVASVWVDVIGSLASKIEGVGQGAAPDAAQRPVPAFASAIGFRIKTSEMVEAHVEMFRPVGALAPQPLVSTDVTPPQLITEVHFEPGAAGAAGQVSITVPKGQAAGVYHGFLLAAETKAPAGVLTLTVHAGDAPGGPA
ncbi:MAG: hypothetical protein AAF307_04675 [Pseudomonadota bacterium]